MDALTATPTVTSGAIAERRVGRGTAIPLLRLEGGLALSVAVAAYAHFDFGWGLFALLFLAPDIAMLGYLKDTRTGAIVYNLGHSHLAPAALALVGLVFHGSAVVPAIALIWAAHIGFDRMIGYGLKYPDAFGATHLGRHGRAPQAGAA